jgi:hypothetical protein
MLFMHQRLEPCTEEEFLAFMDYIGAAAPPAMTTVQLVSTLAAILSNYCDADDAETMDQVTRAAVDTILECESAAMLDLSVGPEDGVN